ncbi:MAG: sulfotransferase [Rhodovulum sp.]|nr:sulfotransferase [Rhodovulum sp.]
MLPLSSAQIKSTYEQAMKLMSAGKLDEADKMFAHVAVSAPKLAEPHFQRGRISLLRRQPGPALLHLANARRLKPKESAIWMMTAETLGKVGDAAQNSAFLAEAKAANLPASLLVTLQNHLAKPVSQKPSAGTAPPAEVQAVIQLVETGKFAEAERRAKALLTVHPDAAILVLVLANAQFSMGKMRDAEANYRKATAMAPNYAEAHNTFGRFLIESDRVAEGIQRVQQALKLSPKLPLGYQNLGIGMMRAGSNDKAEQAFREALKLNKNLPESYAFLARVYVNSDRAEAAIAVYDDAFKAGVKLPIFWARRAEARGKAGDQEGALADFATAVEKGPSNPMIWSLRGMYLQTLGDFDAAEADFRKAIELNPKMGETYRTFFASYKATPDDPLVVQMQDLFDNGGLDDNSKMHMGFALARAKEQQKEYDQVFRYLDPANDLMRKKYPYTIQSRRMEVDGIKTAFEGIDFTNIKPVPGATDFAPIFVTGLPRSGTTLVEQILASHSRVDGAGEVGVFNGELMRMLIKPDGKSFHHFNDLPQDKLAALGYQVEERLRKICPDAERITDKAIQTFSYIGAIKAVIPNAHIVLVRRDPRDTLLSIYKNVFSEGNHRYAYNQRDLGLYYRMFEEIVDFWREKMPGGFYEITYEDLIENPEEEARKLVAACDLEWQDDCLNFHQNDRRVATLSLAQVRQPIYKTSQAAWKRFENDLAPMIEALGDAVD